MENGASEDNTRTAAEDESWRYLSIATIIIMIIWIAYLVGIPRYSPELHNLIRSYLPHGLLKGNQVDLGTFGDYFGALNCLFAGLAYASVFVSIRQQSNSINIQQKELKAQLDEMANSVKEAKVQNTLQREYQFSDELYRRISLLKLIEKDIRYNGYEGTQAAIKMANTFNAICNFILEGNLTASKGLILTNNGKYLLSLKQGIDTFSVWAESYAITLDWLEEYLNEIKVNRYNETIHIKDQHERESILKSVDNEIENKHKKYVSILISSTIWANQYLFALYEDKKGCIWKHSTLLDNPSYANGKIAKNAKDASHRKAYINLLDINLENDIENQLRFIHNICRPN